MDGKDWLILAALGAGAWLLLGRSSSPAPDAGALVPTGGYIPGGGFIPPPIGVSTAPIVSGGYQTASLTAAFGASPSSGTSLPSVYSPPPVSAPPPPFYGGLAGGAGTGGNPLGGTLRAGLSAGTGTTTTAARSGIAHFAAAPPPPLSTRSLFGVPLVIA